MLQKNFIKLWAISFLLTFSFLSVACNLQQSPCDEKIKDKEQVQFNVMSNLFIEQISRKFHLFHVFVNGCYVNGKTQVDLRYALPSEYSEYGYTYVDILTVNYYKKNYKIEVIDRYTRETLPLNSDVIFKMFKERIKNIEASPRVREFYAHMDVDTTQQPFYIDTTGNNAVMLYGADTHYMMVHTLFDDKVNGYTLPNSRIWLEFPEMQRAHQIVDEKLLVGDFSKCSIDTDKGMTKLQVYYTGEYDFSITVVCANGIRKYANVQLNPDGTYQKLELRSP